MAKGPRSDSRFSRVPRADIQRSSFVRNHDHKTTFDSGYLIPIFADEALPGDTFNLQVHAFGRLATPIFPFMDNLVIDTFFFAVPNRLLWDNWQRFMGEKLDPDDTTEFVTPKMTSPAVTGYANGSLSDHLGIPPGVPDLEHVSFFHRAYALVYNEWFRDQNLVDRVPFSKGDGPDNPADYVLQKRGKRHDYFTSSLPWPQKGPSVGLPLGTTAPVLGIGALDNSTYSSSGNVHESGGIDTTYAANSAQATGSQVLIAEDPDNPGYPNIRADLSAATAATINTIRQAVAIQQLLEGDARGGTRYVEILKSHFGVTSPDARLQRPEYLGGGSFPINISPIAQTSESAATPQGNLAAMGTTGARGGFVQSFTEHCIVIGLACVRADLTYQQGLNRMFKRSTRYDYYWPELANIGEQVVHNYEIFAQGTAADEEPFGYQERHAEYRYKPSMITGQFRSSYAQSLDVWHLAQDFATLPALNSEFITEDPPVKRVIATPEEPDILFDARFMFRCARPMPMYSIPGLTRF